jgi:plastocyanin
VVVKEGWGNLKGKFVLSGSLPAPSALQITKDAEVCGKHNLVDESVVVDATTKGIANVVVHLYIGRGESAPTPHDSLTASQAKPALLDNDHCRFEPHVQFLQPGQTLVIKNTDSVGHNTKIDSVDNPAFNQTLPSGAEIEHQFADVERRPAGVSCSIHPWMRGWLVIQDTPYAAVSGANGEFEIANLPSGKWTFQVWHEKAGAVSKASLDGKSTSWSKGRFEVTIQADETNDLGEIQLAADLFKD